MHYFLIEVEKIDRVEDGETVLAAQNVKLMHFTTDSRDWKDKGNGTIKVYNMIIFYIFILLQQYEYYKKFICTLGSARKNNGKNSFVNE